ncbi:MarR family winged helix-turn-helix transcriptional regulator [Tistrella bauzanensis]
MSSGARCPRDTRRHRPRIIGTRSDPGSFRGGRRLAISARRPRLPNPARAEDGRSLRLERFLPYRLSVLANRISSTLARAYADRFDLTIPEWRVVAVLGRFAPLTANAICDATEMDKVTVSRAVQRLERAGRIERTVDDADRRRVLLRLSPAGLDILARIAPLALDYEDRLIAELTPPSARRWCC